MPNHQEIEINEENKLKKYMMYGERKSEEERQSPYQNGGGRDGGGGRGGMDGGRYAQNAQYKSNHEARRIRDEGNVGEKAQGKSGSVNSGNGAGGGASGGPSVKEGHSKPNNRKSARFLENEPQLKEDPDARLQGREENRISYSEVVNAIDDVEHRAVVMWDEKKTTIDGISQETLS